MSVSGVCIIPLASFAAEATIFLRIIARSGRSEETGDLVLFLLIKFEITRMRLGCVPGKLVAVPSLSLSLFAYFYFRLAVACYRFFGFNATSRTSLLKRAGLQYRGGTNGGGYHRANILSSSRTI